jgi:hypothetical protein
MCEICMANARQHAQAQQKSREKRQGILYYIENI